MAFLSKTQYCCFVFRFFFNSYTLFLELSSFNLNRFQQNEFEGFEYINIFIMTPV
jgi:hypothetical protein